MEGENQGYTTDDYIQFMLSSNDPWLYNKGMLLKQISEAYANREITNAEYAELLTDLQRADDMNSGAESMEKVAMVLSVVNVMSKLA